MTYYDYIGIGSGIVGLNTGPLALGDGSVLVPTNGRIDDCNTRHTQGGVAATIGPGCSADLRLKDTLVARAGFCDREALQDQMWRNLGIERCGSRVLLTSRVLNAWEARCPGPPMGRHMSVGTWGF